MGHGEVSRGGSEPADFNPYEAPRSTPGPDPAAGPPAEDGPPLRVTSHLMEQDFVRLHQFLLWHDRSRRNAFLFCCLLLVAAAAGFGFVIGRGEAWAGGLALFFGLCALPAIPLGYWACLGRIGRIYRRAGMLVDQTLTLGPRGIGADPRQGRVARPLERPP